jgi:hypothetical protein
MQSRARIRPIDEFTGPDPPLPATRRGRAVTQIVRPPTSKSGGPLRLGHPDSAPHLWQVATTEGAYGSGICDRGRQIKEPGALDSGFDGPVTSAVAGSDRARAGGGALVGLPVPMRASSGEARVTDP